MKSQKHVERKYIERINSSKCSFFNIHDLYNEPNEVISKVFDGVLPSRRHLLLPSGFPKSYEEIEAFSHHRPTLQKELFVAVCIIKKFQDKISNFLKLKKQFENSLLLGEYGQCRNFIGLIRDSLGYSYWLLEAELLCAHREGGIEENRKKLREIFISNNNPVLRFLGQNASKRIECENSFSMYDRIANECIEGIKNSEKINIIFEITKSKFCPFAEYDSIELATIFRSEQNSSLIDLYECVVRMLPQTMFLLPKEIQEHAIKILDTCNQLKIDMRLRAIVNYFFPASYSKCEWVSLDYLPLLDAYTSEDYDTALRISSNLLRAQPMFFDAYELYVKSMIHNNEQQKASIFHDDSLAQEIIVLLYLIFKRSPASSIAMEELKKIALSIQHTELGASLYYFSCIEEGTSRSDLMFSLLQMNSYGESPRFSQLLPLIRQKKYDSHWEKTYGKHNCAIPVSRAIIDVNDVNLKTREKIYKCQYLLSDRNYAEVIPLATSLLESKLVPYQEAKVIKFLFEAWSVYPLSEQEYSIVSSIIIRNKHLLRGVDIPALYRRLHSQSEATPLHAISFAILALYHFQQLPQEHKDNHIVYGAYASFLESINIDTPLDIIQASEPYSLDISLIIYFLEYICIPRVLEDDYRISSLDDVLEMRIKVCDILSEINPESAEKYHKEALDLAKDRKIKELIKTINSSKIFVDTGNIIPLLNRQCKEDISRFYKLWKMPPNLRVTYAKLVVNAENDQKISLSWFEDESFLVFQAIFKNVVQAFILHPEFGLDHFLSVRIRHGVFDGDVREIFEKKHLVTKRKDDEYLEASYWRESISNEEEFNIVNEALLTLSSQVDQLISKVLSEWLQVDVSIQTLLSDPLGKTTARAFSYVFSIVEQREFWKRLPADMDDDDIFNLIVIYLWERTRDLLDKLRSRLSNELVDIFSQYLQTVEKKVAVVSCRRLSSALTACITDVRSKMIEISSWFKEPENLTAEDYSFKTLFEVCVNIVNSRNAIHFKNAQINCPESCILKGATLIPFVDLILIFLGNIVKHSLDHISKTEIIVAEKEQKITITIKNPVGNDFDYESVKASIDADMNMNPSALKSEGGTGILKARKILQNDLGYLEPVLVLDAKDGVFYVNLDLTI